MGEEESTCPHCGGELSAGIGCPHCLLGLGLGRDEPTESDLATAPLPAEFHSKRIGPYTLLEKLGEGGMGVVYLAEQRKPIRRRVALKLIKLGMDSKQVLARFESERQALAVLDHPHVARVLDGGTTAEGRPYFVMELVAGVPITQFCDRERLEIRQRLELFVGVCEAVHHAHQKGIIHRDLKPSNILVSMQDGRPLPKVIDFGVAKATGQRLTDRTLYTRLGTLVGTPEYMSPEQADPSTLDVDTRTDIYSLGVVLYELLTGALPFERRTPGEVGLLEMQRLHREKEPPRLSARLSGLETAPDAAQRRRTDVRSLRRALRGDLDWIVLQALEKDRSRRYPSASEFASDIQRHLTDEPVAARPPSLAYRFAKLVRRRKGLVGATATVLATILVLGSLALFLGIEERRQAEEVRANAILLAAASAEDPLLKFLLLDEVAGTTDRPGGLAIAREVAETPLPIDVLRGHAGQLCGAAFSADGAWALTAGSDATALLWDLDRDVGPRVVARHNDWVRSAVFSSDGRRILTASDDRTAKVWRLDSSDEPITLSTDDRGHEGWVWSAAFSPDGERIVTASRDGTARIWRSDGTGEPIVLAGHEPHPPGLWNRRTDSDGKVRDVWAVEVRSADFSPDGRYVITAASDRTARVWPADGAGEPWVLEGHDDAVLDAAFHPDGTRIATGSADGTARLWTAPQGEELAVFRGHAGAVLSVAWSPDGRLATASNDGTVRLWSVDGTEEPVVLRGHEGAVADVAFNLDGSLLITASEDGTARLWPANWEPEGVVLAGHRDGVTSAAYDSDGSHVVTASKDGTARVWTANGTLLRVLEGHEGPVNDARFAPDGGSVVTASDDRTVRIWPSVPGGVAEILRGHRDAVLEAAFSPDGLRVASASADGTARLWRVDSPDDPLVLRGHTRQVTALAFTPGGDRLATGSVDGTVRIWPMSGDGEPVILTKERWGVLDLAFDRSGSRLAVAYEDDTALLWNIDGSSEPVVLGGHQDWVRTAAFSPDGSQVVTASDDYWARLWRSDGAGDPVALKGHQDYVLDAAFSPDGSHVLTVSWDGTARVWRADGAGDPVVLRGHRDQVNRGAFSPDGSHVLTASADGTARIWLVGWVPLLEHLRRGTRACLTADQRVRFLAESPDIAEAARAACESDR